VLPDNSRSYTSRIPRRLSLLNHVTAQDLRKEHLKAMRLDSTKEVHLFSETEEEIWAAMRSTDAGPMEVLPRFRPDGRRKMVWET
jgi:hypothetical protein